MKIFIPSCILFTGLCLLPMITFAGSDPEISVGIDYNTAFIDRGEDVFPDNDPVVITSLGLAASSGLVINAALIRPIEKREITKVGDQFDFTGEYARSVFEKLETTLGLCVSMFPNSHSEPDGELYLSLITDFVLNPSLTFYYEFMHAHDGYLEMAVTHEEPINERISIVGGAVAGFDFGQYIAASQLTNIDLFLSPAVTLNNFTLNLQVHYILIPDKEIPVPGDNGYWNDENEFWFGLGVSALLSLD